jgi:hypothetical protein
VGEWAVRLIAEGEGLYDPGNQLGQLVTASCGRDSLDLKELAPHSAPYLTVVFPHPEWEGDHHDFTTDFRPRSCDEPECSVEWTFEVRTSQVGQPVTLRWEEAGLEAVLPYGLLTDQAAGVTVATPRGGSYTFTPTAEVTVFSFSLTLEGSALIFADDFELGTTVRWSDQLP